MPGLKRWLLINRMLPVIVQMDSEAEELITGAATTGCKKSHETEGMHKIPRVFCDSNVQELQRGTGPTRPQAPRLSKALDESRRQGTRAILKGDIKELELFSIQAREDSFKISHDWQGPPPAKMALAGWYYLSKDVAQCRYCLICARNWTKDDDPWKRHKQLSPCCRRLKQVCDPGIHACAQGKQLYRHSFSSIHDLLRPAMTLLMEPMNT